MKSIEVPKVFDNNFVQYITGNFSSKIAKIANKNQNTSRHKTINLLCANTCEQISDY